LFQPSYFNCLQDCKSIRVNKVATETSAVAVDAVNEVAELAVLLPFSK
jgi:hypothetical protein